MSAHFKGPSIEPPRCELAAWTWATGTDPGEKLPGVAAPPKAPVLGWRSLWPAGGSHLPSIDQLPHRAYTTSGRAALFCALKQLALPAGSGVLVPTYHCPTMVAPVLQAGFTPLYFPIGPDGLPMLDGIAPAVSSRARVMFVAHYFGLPKSLHKVRAWCDERGITLVEDCAHSYFGQAGNRPVGAWGDLATASLSKFFPVAEGGMLASSQRPLHPLGLAPAGLRAQVKGGFSVLEYAQLHGRLAGISHLLAPLMWLKNGRHPRPSSVELPGTHQTLLDVNAVITSCDMDRVGQAPPLVTLALHRMLPKSSIISRRQLHFRTYDHAFAQPWARDHGIRPLSVGSSEHSAPYVYPLWVDDAAQADALYTRLRMSRLPVFRWDRLWPGTPADAQDSGTAWSRQVLQLLCHQDLGSQHLDQVIDCTRLHLHAA